MKNEKLFNETQQILLGLELIHPDLEIISKLRFSIETMTLNTENADKILKDLFNIIKVIGEYEITSSLEVMLESKDVKEVLSSTLKLQAIASKNETYNSFKICLNNFESSASISDFEDTLLSYLDHDQVCGDFLKRIYSETNVLEKIKKVLDFYHSVYKEEVFENLKSFYKHYFDLGSTQKLWEFLSKYTEITIFHRIKRVYQQELKANLADAFSKGQLKSKIWAVDELMKIEDLSFDKIYLMCGWYALLARIYYNRLERNNEEKVIIKSIDIDEDCRPVADCLNFDEHVQGIFKTSTMDIFDFVGYENNSLVINTSCEHLAEFKKWYEMIPVGQLMILQSNNYFSREEHVNCVESLDEFKRTAPMSDYYFSGELELPEYKRFMLIGKK